MQDKSVHLLMPDFIHLYFRNTLERVWKNWTGA